MDPAVLTSTRRPSAIVDDATTTASDAEGSSNTASAGVVRQAPSAAPSLTQAALHATHNVHQLPLTQSTSASSSSSTASVSAQQSAKAFKMETSQSSDLVKCVPRHGPADLLHYRECFEGLVVVSAFL